MSFEYNDPDDAGWAHRQPSHHPDGTMVENLGVQYRSSHQPDAIPTDDGGSQDPLNMDDRRFKRTDKRVHTIMRIVSVDPMRH